MKRSTITQHCKTYEKKRIDQPSNSQMTPHIISAGELGGLYYKHLWENGDIAHHDSAIKPLVQCLICYNWFHAIPHIHTQTSLSVTPVVLRSTDQPFSPDRVILLFFKLYTAVGMFISHSAFAYTWSIRKIDIFFTVSNVMKLLKQGKEHC